MSESLLDLEQAEGAETGLLLEDEIAAKETVALHEEQKNADDNYAALDQQRRAVERSMPYPEVGQNDTAFDYDDWQNLQLRKRANASAYAEINKLEEYIRTGRLYAGHIRRNGRDFYLMDNLLGTYLLSDSVWLIDANDRSYNELTQAWMFPTPYLGLDFARNVTMKEKTVTDVEVKLDVTSSAFSELNDSYLRKALIRNKGKAQIESILQTIQKEQDNIRTLATNDSFVLQGCAGSGKTMVLLHRLKYLLTNEEKFNDKYLYLVPSYRFKAFVEDAAVNFKVLKEKIIPYVGYYQLCSCDSMKNKLETKDVSELVFAPDILSGLYSKEFMQACYRKFLYALIKKYTEACNVVIEDCDKKLQGIVNAEEQKIKTLMFGAKDAAQKAIKNIVGEGGQFVGVEIEPSLENLAEFLEKLQSDYDVKKDICASVDMEELNREITKDDPRISGNEMLLSIAEDIQKQELIVAKASRFTVAMQKLKLEQLKLSYAKLQDKLYNMLVAEQEEKKAKFVNDANYVYPGVTLAAVEDIIARVTQVKETLEENMAEYEKRLDNVYTDVEIYNRPRITALNRFIELSSDFVNVEDRLADALEPVFDTCKEIVNLGNELLLKYYKLLEEEYNGVRSIKKEYKIFISVKMSLNNLVTRLVLPSPSEIRQTLYAPFMHIIKAEAEARFGVSLASVYKHYWYLSAYSSYLLGYVAQDEPDAYRYVFIDEVQDLSISEIEFIAKRNTAIEYTKPIAPVFNMFGDINQTITAHGVASWDAIEQVKDVYTLNQNFRNTNQIIEYCNSKLGMSMAKVGVDMDEVDEYDSLRAALAVNRDFVKECVFIVKDEYAMKDFRILAAENDLEDYTVLTVKLAKGLEFKEACVFTEAMSDHEQYIAFTRALAKLTVIKELPKLAERRSLIIEGE